MNVMGARAPHRRWIVGALGGALLATLLTGVAVAIARQPVPDAASAATARADAPAPPPVLRVAAGMGPRPRVTWRGPLVVRLSHGRLDAVTVLDPDGVPLAGSLDGDRWESMARTLVPAATYSVTGSAVLADGRQPVSLTVRTTAAERVLHATLSPGDDAVVGVGQPVVVRLDRPVTSATDRDRLVSRLTVRTEPSVPGAWRWMADDELHYRGPTYWPAGTRFAVTADLARLRLSDDTWGLGHRTSRYTAGDALISTVDVRTHQMTVRRNGEVLKVLKVSTGRDEFPTHNGVHLVLEKTALKTMDSSTIGIPRGGPGGYFLKVPNSVRISYSGEFVHSAPGTVRQQGVANVSHGCVNLAPADAAWFFALAQRGDVVEVKGSPRPPLSYDPGTSDWNMTYRAWSAS